MRKERKNPAAAHAGCGMWDIGRPGHTTAPCYRPKNIPHPTSHRRAGFTLIELLVVITIIVLLLSIVVVAIGRMHEARRHASTIAMLNQLSGVLAEYEAQTHDTLLPDPSPTKNSLHSFIRQVIFLGDGNPAEMMLRTIKPEYWNVRYVRLDTNPGYTDTTTSHPLEIIDDWGTRIEFVGADGTNDDLTLASNRQPMRPKAYFASAGPDELWGEFTDGNPDDPTDDAMDNLFSFKSIK